MKPLPCPSSYHSQDSELSQLVRLLGRHKFAQLQEVFGGRRLWIPKPGVRFPCRICRQRNPCIRAWRKQGHPVESISGHLGISPKTAYRILGHRRKS